ncbi:MAG: flavodoxin [Treponema sp.]|jgi:flavodoxin|nr:flavodoxin [Treponema sp.]
MKTAVVFYSSDGNSALIAAQFKTNFSADLLRVEAEGEKKRGFLSKLFWGCGMVFSGKNPPLKPYSFDPSAYDLIVLGAPVWAGNPAPPIKTFLSQTPINGKKVIAFVCHAGGSGNSLKKFTAMLSGNEIVGVMDFQKPLENIEEHKKRIEETAKGLLSGVN